ncbi:MULTISPECIES: hypothetical protein [Tenacibaculum]|uniref:hypothetical protein n=1 Tax=Tenacibaculum TaxID=104267 RepID=UPI001F0A3CE2|nr:MULTISPECIES: hypothetical protein [Tenacibaculum]MCH3883041.1 hypothetical protein [Tenacibaculum aquimarinum]MDO6600536.1 hypothetical protein [Tenacibaculum sp. 1_MG-2023]
MREIITNRRNKIQELNEKGGIGSIISNFFSFKNHSIEENTKTLLNYGWYISGQMEMKETSKVIDLIKNENIVEAENIMIKFFKENLSDIEKRLIKKHSERENLFKESFRAHRNKMFYSSTILFLSQADGIIDGKIFHNRKNLDKHLDKDKNPSFVNILKEDSSLNVPSYKINKEKYFSKLNRHSVMHGKSTDYGTEINSLKALSLCCFVSDWYNRYE